jgi:hypothetical protein
MAEQNKDRNLDNQLDSLLAQYSDAQPRPGLETRILAQLREQAARKKSWQWIWIGSGAVAVAALAMLVLTVRLERTIESPQPLVFHADWSLLHRPGSTVTQAPGKGVSVIATQANAHPEHPMRPHPRHKELEMAEVREVGRGTRPDVFPTPAPLSDQERLMLLYLARTAKHEIVAQSHPDEPVEIAEPLLLQIQPPARTEFNNSTR